MIQKNLITGSLAFLLVLFLTACAGSGNLETGENTSPVETEAVSVSDPTPADPTPADRPAESEAENFLVYSNQDYGFAFLYPDTWTTEEVDHAVVVKNGHYVLRVNYRFASENIPPMFGRTGVGSGEFVDTGTVNFLGLVLPVRRLVGEGRVKAVFYQQREINFQDQVFLITLEAIGIQDYRAIDIPAEIQADALAILDSFEKN